MRDYLYYQDAMIQQFETTIERTGQEADGRAFIVLHNTAFYPTGGGQPHDTGWIAGIEVIDVEKVEDEIRHYIAGDVPALSGMVACQVNWARRFDHMQQHAGQHILTAAFVELFDLPTVSFHLGAETSTIDLQTPTITAEQLQAAEDRANAILLENRPIETKWVSKEELANYKLRKDVAVEGDIRLVIIPDYDYNGCGGTHPTSTGQVSTIKILEIEKMKQNIRVHFVCGQRVVKQLQTSKRVLSDVARQLSVPETQAADALRKVMNDAKAANKALVEAQDCLLQYEAQQLASTNLVAQAFENRSMQDLQKLGRFILQHNDQAVVLLATKNDHKLQFVATRGTASTSNMQEVSKAVLPLINGKGGGNPALVQGGGDSAMTAKALVEEMRAVVATSL